VDDDFVAGLPSMTALNQNYPNPFNAHTVISFDLQNQSNVKIEIYDILGRGVKTLINEQLPAGKHQVVWDASAVSSGIYFYKLSADGYNETRRMLLVK